MTDQQSAAAANLLAAEASYLTVNGWAPIAITDLTQPNKLASIMWVKGNTKLCQQDAVLTQRVLNFYNPEG